MDQSMPHAPPFPLPTSFSPPSSPPKITYLSSYTIVYVHTSILYINTYIHTISSPPLSLRNNTCVVQYIHLSYFLRSILIPVDSVKLHRYLTNHKYTRSTHTHTHSAHSAPLPFNEKKRRRKEIGESQKKKKRGGKARFFFFSFRIGN